jgi:2-amino-4-hydroxy-6-hydroxymethyldihydropteridine diphosphokinase
MSQSSSRENPEHEAVVRAVISLGSNMGERETHVLWAAGEIASASGVRSARLSSLFETSPIGEEYTRPFINAVMIIETVLDPYSLLELGLSLEIVSGRERNDESGDRTLDVDIILYGEVRIDEPDLSLPHPRLMERRFVLVPLAELDPSIPLPAGTSACEAAESEAASGIVKRISCRSRTGGKLY